MIAALYGNGSLNQLYPQYNNKKIKPIRALRGDERSTEDLSIRAKKNVEPEVPVYSKYETDLLTSAKDKEFLSYSSVNPYDQAKQTIDESLLVGIHLDVLA